MKKTLTFVHPVLHRHTDVSLGTDAVLVLGGVAAAVAELFVMLDAGGGLSWPVLGAGIALAHARQWRHLHTWPVVASLALALMSSGLSMLITGWVLNRGIARRYRGAGWKVRDTEGELGEYSSRFLAVDGLGFRESDLVGGVVRRHLRAGLEEAQAGEVLEPVTPQARRRRRSSRTATAQVLPPSLPTLLSRPVAPPRAAETASAGEIDAPR
ncbi:hypothetical protein ACU6VI_14435 [Sphaerotilus natans]|uniref:hypothetical protein n=1 Tax=Sphaerotilus natans TaxID=34103 RepID=UPI00406BF8F2